ncbi:MAG: SMP-30/gluconolactonase/LRE family protein [Actinomycetia bacterium]|nr:SMP-30/gluconolactonase/LRE family protein [Actinomycetes bacterium]MCP4957779.1 SMP-30/gluconolactonase/LRE family protein [Actinomycetes bacterium]
MLPTITELDAPVAALGECPVWSAVEGALYWVDIEGHAIHRHHLDSGDTTTRQMGGRPGSFTLTQQASTLLVAIEHKLVTLDWPSGTVEPFAELESAGTGNRLNDGKCDPAGRFVVGSMYANTAAGNATGLLHQFTNTSTVAELRANIGVANGLAFDPDRRLMYFADSPTEQVLVFDYDPSTGAVSDERLFFDYTAVPGKPDGACLDDDGCYWSASVYGWQLLRITPNGGIDRAVQLPLQKPSMPCFGGPNLDIMFVTTIGADGNTSSDSGRDGFTPGATLVIEGLGVRGRTEPVFDGP